MNCQVAQTIIAVLGRSHRGFDQRLGSQEKSHVEVMTVVVVVQPRSECSTGAGGIRCVNERQTRFAARRMAATREAVEA